MSVKKLKTQARQGDVFIKKVKSFSKGEKTEIKRDGGAVVLAYGEVTGHKHQVKEKNVKFFSVKTSENMFERFLEVTGDTSVNLVHEEHSTIQIPPGLYKIGTQREYTPEAIVPVRD